jgi:DNA-binding CsgD family transcriptional regulator
VEAHGLVDRVAERDRIDRLLADVRAGASGVLLIRGQAGIGKTSLLRYATRRASSFSVAHVGAVEAEMELPLAGLHQLCVGMLDGLDGLPVPQRDALCVALGLASGKPPDRFLLGLAVLSLVSAAAERRPLCCLVEDAQWLDAASGQVLGFVARRLLAESVAVIVAVRDPAARHDFQGLPELRLEGLQGEPARALLATAVTGRLDDDVSDRIVAETGGNPLALLELPRRMTAAELAGGFALPAATGLPTHLEDLYRRRVSELPPATQTLLLLAAADQSGDARLVWGAALRMRIDPGALAPAVDAELLVVGAQLRFRHPLVRSAVYRAAPGEERQRVHAALAVVSHPDRDADRRAWHRALAADGPDEDVAAELERSAGRAQARGGMAGAAAFLQRSAALTQDPLRRSDRALAAAQASLRAGAFDAARGLLATAEAGPLDELGRARAVLLQAEVAFAQDRGGRAPLLLLEAARRLEPLDVRLARRTYLEAWGAALFAGDLARSVALPEISRAAATAPRPAAPTPGDLLLDGLSLVFTEGLPAAAPVLRRAVGAFAGPDVPEDELLRWGWLATRAANLVWDHDSCLGIGERAVRLARDCGALDALAVAGNACGQAAAFAGDFAGAALLVAEVDAIREATGTRIGRHAALVLAALRGRESEAAELVEATTTVAPAAGQGTALQYAHWATAVLLNGLGRYEEAFAAAVRATEAMPQLHIATWALAELVEAATRSGRDAPAKDALERLGATTGVSRTDWSAGIHARSQALVSDGDAADRCYRTAVEHLGRTGLRPDLARAHLLYGEWLRRQQRRVEARAQLRSAHELFVGIGMEAFAERARAELLATGHKVRARSADASDELTGQEQHIAQLARQGLSNPEIGARLYLSSRTVEWHLHKVFAKLGVRSRRELVSVPAPRSTPVR